MKKKQGLSDETSVFLVVTHSTDVLFPGCVTPYIPETPLDQFVTAFAAKQNLPIVFLPPRKAADPADRSEENVRPTKNTVFCEIGTICTVDGIIPEEKGDPVPTLRGHARVKVLSFSELSEGDFRCTTAHVEECDTDPAGLDAGKLDGYRYTMLKLAKDYFAAAANRIAAKRFTRISDPVLLCDKLADECLTDREEKLDILETPGLFRRFDKLCVYLIKAAEQRRIANEIEKKAQERMDEAQRDYFLHEQLLAINSELGYDDADEAETFRQKLKELSLSPEMTARIEKEINRLSKTPLMSSEAAVLRDWLETVFDFPWNKTTEEKIDLAVAEEVLNRDHYGMEKVKERILEYLAVRNREPSLRHQILCLVGAPGVGKTSVGESIARALGRKYARVSLGGIRDEADIRGHRKTYIGSMPGRIVNAITNVGVLNPVLLLDEIDKLTSDAHGDPASALLEVLDAEQNKNFRDHFLELPVDLSDCFFLCTANTLDTVPKPLLDRMEIIELPGYTPTEKRMIAKEHLLPKQLSRHGLNRSTLRVTDDAIDAIIEGYTREAGVRQLERTIASLCRKTVKRLHDTDAKSITVSQKNLVSLLGERLYLPETAETEDEIGITNGLAYTSVGGALLPVEVIRLPGKGTVTVTGSLGDVMKESVTVAVSVVRSVAESFGIPADFHEKNDLHVHFPDGATPKDGPSAGVTVVTSIASALSCRPVRHDIAMTGEVSLTGKVLPIGGLREKSMAAYIAGIRTVLIPADNEKDLHEVDPLIRGEMTFIPCRRVSDVLSLALRPLPTDGEAVIEHRDPTVKETKVPYLPSRPTAPTVRAEKPSSGEVAQ